MARAELAPEERAAVDAVAACARPGGGWTYVCNPATGPHGVVTKILIRARQIGELTGGADWDVLVLRSPGTPAAGMLLLEAWRRSGDSTYLEVARRAGDLIVEAQLPSGGWASEMPVRGAHLVPWFRWLNQWTALDDDVTSGAARFLVELWQATAGASYRSAAERALDLLVAAQLESGAWPLTWRPRWLVVTSPSFEDLPSTNDGATAGPIHALLQGGRVLDRPDYVRAARRGGDWLVAAQGRPPRAGWAQQYDARGKPGPGRAFEPAALATWESREMADALLALAGAGEGFGERSAESCDGPYSRAALAAASWLSAAAISPGCWARLYDLAEGSPLYADRSGQRVASASDAKRPYKWTGDFGIPGLLAEFGWGDVAVAPVVARPPRRMFGDAGACPDRVPLEEAPDEVNPRARIVRAAVLLQRSERADEPRPAAACVWPVPPASPPPSPTEVETSAVSR